MTNQSVCTNCGYVGKTKTVTKGHFALELILWLCFIVPGVIYSVWRLTSRHEACPVCENKNVIPGNAPLAQKFIYENSQVSPSIAPETTRAPSKGAVSAGRTLGRMVRKILK